jgi:hypothetical protein
VGISQWLRLALEVTVANVRRMNVVVVVVVVTTVRRMTH